MESNLKSLNMSELIALHNKYADQLGVSQENTFKDLKSARAAVQLLEKKVENLNQPEQTAQVDVPFDITPPQDAAAPAAPTPVAEKSSEDKAKYNSTDRRGPNQGVGAFAKEQIAAGKSNQETLDAVKAKYPSARTTVACIAFYRTALKKPAKGAQAGKTAEQLRQEAQALLDKAKAMDEAAQAAQKEPEKAESEDVNATQEPAQAEAAA